jgi:hypothetical protein
VDAAYVAQVTGQLAIYIGPIAQVIAKKAARESRTRAEFVRKCAENLGTQERIAFLHELGTNKVFRNAACVAECLAWPGATFPSLPQGRRCASDRRHVARL